MLGFVAVSSTDGLHVRPTKSYLMPWEMGRPSPERKQAKRQRQKVRRKLSYLTKKTPQVDQVEVETEPLSEGQGTHGQPESTNIDHYVGPMGGADPDLVEMGLYDSPSPQKDRGPPFLCGLQKSKWCHQKGCLPTAQGG